MTTQQNTTERRLRLTARGRAVLAGLASVPLVVGIAIGAAHANSAAASNDSVSETFEYVTVSSGESLWTLAERIAPDSDPRDVVADLVSLNQLGTSAVGAGERIAIPSQYDAGAR